RVSATTSRDALEAFRRAVETGDLRQLLEILAPDVVFLGDGGGVVQAVTTPVTGAAAVARLLTAGIGNFATGTLTPAQVNGHPALILRRGGEVDTVLALRVDDGLVTGLYAVRNPAKLSRLDDETVLRR
ncbi:RNA polymerase subunit sigma-24, partial [Amycolatopsis sp. SID8362]|nr:RNA polymerase subunit sigma-24 [Amycolatopsis sp. SID8362]NED41891.1 RNA polymerase subunit sigma-24 [Amycolatopsis sp. SID8362]